MTEGQLLDRLVEIRRDAYNGRVVAEKINQLILERWGVGKEKK